MTRLWKSLVLPGVAVAAVLLGVPSAAFADVLTPESPHSPNAGDIRDAYLIVFVIMAIVGIAAIGALIVALRRFRAGEDAPRSSERAAPRAQAVIAAGLAALAAAILVIGAVYTDSAETIEPTGPNGLADYSPMSIDVSGQQWLWRYEYPDELKADPGGPALFSYHELVVPVDTAIKLNVRSVDVMHRWSVPALAPMATAVPGEVNETWFKADEEGTYEGRTTQYAGPATAAMRTRVRVVSAADFTAWANQQQGEIKAAQDAVQEAVDAGAAPGVAS